MTKRSPFRYFKTSPEIIRLAVMLYVRLPLSLRNVEDLLHERGIEISHETVRFWWNRFGPYSKALDCVVLTKSTLANLKYSPKCCRIWAMLVENYLSPIHSFGISLSLNNNGLTNWIMQIHGVVGFLGFSDSSIISITVFVPILLWLVSTGLSFRLKKRLGLWWVFQPEIFQNRPNT